MNKTLYYIFGILSIFYIAIFVSFKIVISSDAETSKTQEIDSKEVSATDNKSIGDVIEEGGFLPVPEPGPGDWLANYHESGQTFKEFIKDERNVPDSIRGIIYILPIEDFSTIPNTPSLSMFKDFTESYFNMPVEILPSKSINLKNINKRINSFSKDTQYHAGDIIEEMKKSIPKDAFCVIAITITDLYPEDGWNFVFGLASFLERVGVFSFARYYPSFYLGGKSPYKDDRVSTLLNLRCCKIICHEIGHMFGMMHCISYLCNMNGSNNLEEFDNQPIYLCPVCLKKLQYSTKFNVKDRYQNLFHFYEKSNFTQQGKWLKGRMENLEKEK